MDPVYSKHSAQEFFEVELSGPAVVEKLADVQLCKDVSNDIDIAQNSPKTINHKIEGRIQLDSTTYVSRVLTEAEQEQGEINGQVRYHHRVHRTLL